MHATHPHLISRIVLTLGLAMLVGGSVQAQEINAPSTDAVFVKVTQNRSLSGTPIELTEFKVTTGFGEVTIPLSKIDGIKFHANPDDSAVIAFKNGDLVTGKISVETISIKTEWGRAHIKVSQIDSVTANPAARFFPDPTSGNKGWRFSNGVTNR